MQNLTIPAAEHERRRERLSERADDDGTETLTHYPRDLESLTVDA